MLKSAVHSKQLVRVADDLHYDPEQIETILQSLRIYLDENQNMDSIFGIYNLYNRFWFNETAINHNPHKLDGTQYIKPIKAEVGFYVFRRKAFLKEKSRVTKKYFTIEVNKIEDVLKTKFSVVGSCSICLDNKVEISSLTLDTWY